MRAVFGLVLIVGLGLAGFAVYMAKNQFSAYESELERQRAANGGLVDLVDLYVANRPLKYGELLHPEDVRQVKWPAHVQPEGVFYTAEALFPGGEDEPRVVLRNIETNEAIMDMKVTKPGEPAGLTSLLERGTRAFAINVDVSSGVSGFLRPGDRVDVYWTGSIQGVNSSDREVTKLIEAAVPIIAIDQTANADASAATIARTITVAIKPQQVAGLAQAQSTGRLSLSLVGAEDDTIAENVEVDQRTLLGLAAAAAPVEIAREEVCTIRTRRGAEVVEIPIPCTN